MANPTPDYPENVKEGIKNLQKFYYDAVESRYISSNYDEPSKIIANLYVQLAKLGLEINKTKRHGDKTEPSSTYALLVAEIMFEIVRLSNSKYKNFDLSAALENQETIHNELEVEREAKSKQADKDWYDKQPKYHAEGSGLNPLREDGLYGKAAQAADGDWYGSH